MVRLVVDIEESVLLLETEPRLRFLCLVHDLLRVVTVVGPVGGSVVVVRLGENENVVATTEGIPEDGRRTKVDVRVVSGGLVRRRTIKVPDTEVAEVLYGLGDRL